MRRLLALPLALLLLPGCQSLTAPYTGDTGLTGLVVRGPMQPVCHEGEPCEDDPFEATFYVYAGRRRAATFRSGEDGRFTVRLPPGPYAVVPGRDAPIMAPESQRQEVVVGPEGLTEVTLSFDTGIR